MLPGNPNDLGIDAKGNVYFTEPRHVGDEPREIDFEGIFVVTPDGEVTPATRDVKKPNGIVVSADGKTMFVADHHGGPDGVPQLVSFSVREDGTLAYKKVLHDFEKSRGQWSQPDTVRTKAAVK
jgi:sugar lactone lactonase YvrE